MKNLEEGRIKNKFMRNLTIIILFFALVSFGKTSNLPKDTSKKSLETNYMKTVSQNEKLIFENEQLKNQYKVLSERMEQASDTINNQNSLFSGFSIIYTIITIIIALLGIVLPILTYQFGIKPSQKALKEFEQNIDKKLEKYLIKTRNKQIEQAIENLSSQDQELKISALNFLSITNHQGYSEQQIFKLFQLLQSDKLDELKKSTLANLLSSKKNEFATEYFKKAIIENWMYSKYAAIKYFSNIGIENHITLFRNLIKESIDKNSEFYQILTYAGISNKNAAIYLINDKEFIDNIDSETLKIFKSNGNSLAKSFQLNEDEFVSSYLKEKLSSI
jgi:hypothetical protein